MYISEEEIKPVALTIVYQLVSKKKKIFKHQLEGFEVGIFLGLVILN